MSTRSQAYKHEMEIGRQIADRLPQVMTQVQVAQKLGIRRQSVARIERRALYKVQQRLRELFRQDGITV